MSWLSDAHSEWHTVNGSNASCPLDCAAGDTEAIYAFDLEDDLPLVKCGRCKSYHYGVEGVRDCYAGRPVYATTKESTR